MNLGINRLVRQHRQLILSLDREFSPTRRVLRWLDVSSREPTRPDLGWDAFALFSDSPLIEHLSPGARNRAAERLVKAVGGRAVHPKRWQSRIRFLVRREAEAAGISLLEARTNLVRAALMEAIRGTQSGGGRGAGIGGFSAQRWSTAKEKQILNGVESVLTAESRRSEPIPRAGRDDHDGDVFGQQESGQGDQAEGVIEIKAAVRAAAAFSDREQDVLVAAAMGCNSSEIAANLGISASSVRTYLARAREKLGPLNEAD